MCSGLGNTQQKGKVYFLVMKVYFLVINEVSDTIDKLAGVADESVGACCIRHRCIVAGFSQMYLTQLCQKQSQDTPFATLQEVSI